MELNKNDRGKCGIYKIVNKINNKIYVGKAKDIYLRIQSHIYALNKKSKDENRHLINAWYKYGGNNFEYVVIEELDLNEDLLREREDFWIVELKATDRNLGYNLRRDSSTGLIISEETRKLKSENSIGDKNPNYGNKWTKYQREKMSKRLKEEFASGKRIADPECGRKACAVRNKRWEENPKLKENMQKKVSDSITEYNFYQYDKITGELIKVWDSVYDILKENPNWKRHNIYAACSGEKPSIYGYKWKKVLKDDIVQQ